MHSHKMEPNVCVPNPYFPGTIVILDVFLPEPQFLVPHQMQWFAIESVAAKSVSLHNIPTLYDRLGHTLCKGLLEPNSWLQGLLFYDCFSPYDDYCDGMFHDPNSYERFYWVYSNNSYHRIFKNYLVRREMVCRERRTRPLALPRRPKASAVSIPPICESQLANNS